MPPTSDSISVYLELGAKKVFAGALDWPGWCVHGRDAEAALQALVDAGPRYAAILTGTRLGFTAPKTVGALTVVERLRGNAATDYGAANIPPQADAQPVDAADLRRLEKIANACWAALDVAVSAAEGLALRKGPRGGGRDLEDILRHVLDAQLSYLTSFGWKAKRDDTLAPAAAIAQVQAAMLAGLAASARSEIEPIGPRGGVRWSARYLVRRSAWHITDHIGEIEQRLAPG